jgi:methyl-accepting chemotaxis protein
MQDGYKSLHSHITETLNIIEDVSIAAKEQMKGIEQVSDAIVTLNKITKENESETIQITSIAAEVSEMAYEVVEDAKNKKF